MIANRARHDLLVSREETVVSADDLRAVRAALPRALPRARAERAEVEVPLRAVCERAHRLGLRAEELLVQVKGLWRELPEARRVEALASRDEQLDVLVSLLIEEFYRAPRSA